ncbi:MAG: 2-oxo-4-hydroxy-4-carboxy-5-ureidoimidazoline decarboxylase [Pseudomonadota bacterium]|nr:2-oxo-4-hydroxy-4-carboxy-5-ureidoimidazoline decarboxylase [Pseudomonadota bacterium]
MTEPGNENRTLKASHMEQNAFVDTFGGVYEHSSWVAEEVFAAGLNGAHDTIAGLHNALRDVVDNANRKKQLTLLRAHPDLAGKLAITGALTPESTAEQASANLDQCTAEEFDEFQCLNGEYKNAFGFPYILAVRGRNRQEILQNFRSRVSNDADSEFTEALKQVHQIALLRLESIFQEEH